MSKQTPEKQGYEAKKYFVGFDVEQFFHHHALAGI
jgi:hypothetical protein